MDIGQILTWKYPDADSTVDFIVRDDGNGSFIAFWDTVKLGPQPTPAQLQSWELDAAKYFKRREIRRGHESDYREKFALDGQFMESERDFLFREEARQGRENLSTGKRATLDALDALRADRDTKLQTVRDATTVTQVEAVSWGAMMAAQASGGNSRAGR